MAPDFCNNRHFHDNSTLFSNNFWFTIHVDSWFWRKFDRICWAYAIFRSIYLQACTDGRTDGPTDELIPVGLGNIRFLQVNGDTYVIHSLCIDSHHRIGMMVFLGAWYADGLLLIPTRNTRASSEWRAYLGLHTVKEGASPFYFIYMLGT